MAGFLDCLPSRDFWENTLTVINEIGRGLLADRIMYEPPEIGYLTVSNALQWRLQYGRAIGAVGTIEGVEDLLE